jgi:hypothetical protein
VRRYGPKGFASVKFCIKEVRAERAEVIGHAEFGFFCCCICAGRGPIRTSSADSSANFMQELFIYLFIAK